MVIPELAVKVEGVVVDALAADGMPLLRLYQRGRQHHLHQQVSIARIQEELEVVEMTGWWCSPPEQT